MLLGLLRPQYAQASPNEEQKVEKPPETLKSGSVDQFLESHEAKSFIKRWSDKKVDGKKAFTKRGVVALIRAIFMIPSLSSNKQVLSTSEELLTQLGGMDGLQGFLLGFKVKSEGIMKAVKSFVGRE